MDVVDFQPPRLHRPPSRRHLRTITAVLAAAALTLTACAKSSSGTGSGNAPASGAAAVAGGTLTFGEQQPPTSLNPGIIDRGYTDFTMLAYEPLFRQGSDGTIQPALAASWKYVGTGNTQLDVVLRSGVKFSDGEAVTAKAVKASLEYARDGQSNQAHLLTGLTFTAVDDTHLTIKMATANPILPNFLTQTWAVGEIISPKGLADPAKLNLTTATQGAGPYVFDPAGSVSGDHYTYTANPNYYDKTKQHYQKVVIKIFANSQAALNATKTGQLAVFKGDLSIASQAKSASLQVVANPAILNGLMLFDRNGKVSKPLADVRVRQAINYAIDRAAVTKALLGTYGVPTTQTVVKGGDGYSDKAAAQYPYDPAKAKALLTAAGYPNGFKMSVVSAVFAGFKDMGDAIAGQLAKVDITLDLQVATDIPTYIANGSKLPAIIGGLDPLPMYQQGLDLWMPGSKQSNPYQTTSTELETLWKKAASADQATRSALDVQMQQYLVDQAWFTPVAFTPVLYVAAKTLGGVATSTGAPFASPTDWYPTN